MRGAILAEEQQGSGDSRGAIISATREAIARDGIRGMRLDRVAAQAGVSVPLVYYHFDSRPGLIRAVMRAVGDRAPSQELRERSAQTSGREAVANALLAELDQDREVRDDAIIWGEVSASAVFDSELRDELRRVNESWRELIATVIDAGRDDGSVAATAEPVEAAELLIALVDGLLARWLAGTLQLEGARRILSQALDATLPAPDQ